jgi:tetratricopeptide (TPR) repeat protein
MTATTAAQVTLDQALELHRAGNLAAAGEAYAALLEHDAGNHDARYGLGTVRMQQGDLEDAQSLLEQAVAEAPEIPEYHYNLGCVLEQLGQAFDAVEQFKLAYQGMPDSPAILRALGKSLSSLQDFPAAITAMEQALRIESPQAADVLAYADMLFMAHEPDKAMDQVRRARELGSNDPLGYFIEARCARLAGNHNAMLNALQEAIDLRPGYGDAWQYLLEITPDDELLSLASDCEGLAGDAATETRDKAKLGYVAGQAYERLGEYNDAVEQFHAANRRQCEFAELRGKGYDPEAGERHLAWAESEFDGTGTSASPTSAETQPIFIVGMPRSGTTLVESILGELEGVTTGGESEALELATSRYYRAGSQGQWPRVQELQPQHWDELAAAYWQTQLTPQGRVTDKMPTNFRHVGMICRMFSSAPVIHMRRDPRDVAWSIYSRYFPPGHRYATDLEDIAHYYSLSLQLMEHFKSLHPDRILEVRYEELIDRPEELTQQIAAFCGLEWRKECLAFHERPRASYTFSELQVREPLNRKGIGRWRNYAEAMTPFVDACVAHGVPLEDN